MADSDVYEANDRDFDHVSDDSSVDVSDNAERTTSSPEYSEDSSNEIELSTPLNEIAYASADTEVAAFEEAGVDDSASLGCSQSEGEKDEPNVSVDESVQTTASTDGANLPQQADSYDKGAKGNKAIFGNKKVLYGVLAVAAMIIAIILMTNSGTKLDASARLDQVTISYPSAWSLSEEKAIFVNEGDEEAGVILWSTSGDYFGKKGIEAISSVFSDDVDFNGDLSEANIDGVTAYKQAIVFAGMSGEALFVPTDEGITLVMAAMPTEDQELQATLKRVLDSATLTPGTKCTITIKSEESTLNTILVYDYGNGASCTMFIDDGDDSEEIPTSGEVITGWETSDSSVRTVKNDEGAWEITGVTTDVTLDAVWTAVHKVTFMDGEGNAVSEVGVLDGEAAAAPDEPRRKGFVFDGWDKDFSQVTDDITVNAKWAKAHTVTFTDGNGNTLATLVVKDGESAKAPSDPTRNGYEFAGWDADFSKITDDVTVNAKWDSKFKATLRSLGDFEQQTINGSGDDVVDIPCAGMPCIMIVNNDGSRNFVIKTLDSSGGNVDLLVNEIGPYSGIVTTYLDFKESQMVEVKSSGSWSITFAPLADMQEASNGSTFSGDNVVAINEDALTKVHFTNDGPSNFVVKAIGLGSSDLLVNEIGSYDGTVAWNEPQSFFIVRSSGTWSISW